ncbi:hypothetical protein NT2_13_00610 [Caenibius tardaugens NBRC 16725]|uniref:Uncharacterized protein n=1 Tax=Caenibius tardaugens NBRC 16725 TaxID=1219035 RepID=U3A007_9SPHN|nr:hypothetical protein [Caenibius tardaugens]AZI37896.1 hypothetical protein EGO55_19610 [Caenibius tardaugens NBRC 16725]GAD50974.1 hypothetical protein NT2_13_00610 [Caenibius tardaugens NBRC 16725]
MPTDTIVREQGRTRKFRPSDFAPGKGAKHLDNRVPSKERRRTRPERSPSPGERHDRSRRDRRGNPMPGHPDYQPRNPRKAAKLPARFNPPRLPARGFGVKKSPVPDFAPLFKPLRIPKPGVLGLLDLIPDKGLPLQRPLKPEDFVLPVGWYIANTCPYFPVRWNGNYRFTGAGSGTSPCLSGQALPSADDNMHEANFPNIRNAARYIYLPYVVGNGHRGQQYIHFQSDSSGVQAGPLGAPPPWTWMPGLNPIGDPVNPNRQRATATQPVADPNVGLALGLQTGLATEAVPEPVLDPGMGSNGTRGMQVSARGRRPIRVRMRVPPKRREREGKMDNRLARLRVLFWRALDSVSEFSEVIDSFYDALPKEVKKKWDCGRKSFGIDNAGQYGIENADCKAAALWYNWHKVDFESAIENVIKNHIEDSLYGFFHRNTPKQQGAAFDDSMKDAARQVGAVLVVV